MATEAHQKPACTFPALRTLALVFALVGVLACTKDKEEKRPAQSQNKTAPIPKNKREELTQELADKIYKKLVDEQVEQMVQATGKPYSRSDAEKHVPHTREQCLKSAKRVDAVYYIGKEMGASERAWQAVYEKVLNHELLLLSPHIFSDEWIREQIALEMQREP